jgi:hypothetical protein
MTGHWIQTAPKEAGWYWWRAEGEPNKMKYRAFAIEVEMWVDGARIRAHPMGIAYRMEHRIGFWWSADGLTPTKIEVPE